MFANISWAKASHMVNPDIKIEEVVSISWLEELTNYFAKGHAYRASENFWPHFSTSTVDWLNWNYCAIVLD